MLRKKKVSIVYTFTAGYVLVIILIIAAFYIIDNYPVDVSVPTSPLSMQTQPLPTNLPMITKKIKFHATIPYWEQEKAVSVFKDHVSQFDSLSLFWYTVNDGRKIVTYTDANEDESIIAFAKQNGIKVLALITNLPEEEGTDWDSDRVRNVISTQDRREKHIEDILQLLKEKQFDGVNIDYEELDDDLKDEFSDFIKELSIKLHLEGKIVSVAIHPKSGELIPKEDNGSRAQDWEVIAQYADQMHFMTYGEHWNTSGPGPVASIPWDTKILTYAQRLELPLEKIYLGTPLYGVRWERGTKKGEGLQFGDILQIQKDFNVQPVWHDQWKSPSLEYSEDGKDYIVWFENAKSVEEKLKLAELNKIGGISFWHIGGEDPEVWNVLKQLK